MHKKKIKENAMNYPPPYFDQFYSDFLKKIDTNKIISNSYKISFFPVFRKKTLKKSSYSSF